MQNKIQFLLICLIFLTINSCKVDELCCNTTSDEFLISLSTPNGLYTDVAIPTGNGELIILNAIELFYIYNQKYKSKYPTELQFLTSIYERKIKTIRKDFSIHGVEIIDINIVNLYKKEGLDFIIKSYLVKNEKGSYSFKNKINYTVCYLMFCNNFYLYYDDQLPSFIFKLELDDLALPI